MAVVTPALVAGCSGSDSITEPTGVDANDDRAADSETPTAGAVENTASPTAQAEASSPDPTAAPEAAESSLVWARANLGFVSAYVLARGNTALIVDTGVAGSAEAIGESLLGLGLNYSDVAHVVLTHSHQDHAGSITEVLAQAVNATAYAGEADLGSIPGEISGLAGGEDIFGFEMLPTPGHTPGHIAVVDHQAGLLVAGDAIFTEAGGVVEGPERFFDDIAQSRDSIRAMANLTFNTLLVGHGEPIVERADSAVGALAASFT